MSAAKIRIATRGSALALWQANHIADRLRAVDPDLTVELLVLKTQGDRIVDRALSEVGGKGLFVKEIEEALLDRRAEVAVHSMKDLPAHVPSALVIAAVPEREDPRDALVVRAGLGLQSIAELPPNARLGTSSLRRMCQLRAVRSDLEILPLRGNVDTRLRRLDEGAFDAIVLACAGLRRLGHVARITASLDPRDSLPAIGQGALAVECRADDTATRARLLPLDHLPTACAVAAERAFLKRLDGGCQTPMAAYATLDGQQLRLEGMVGYPDGRQMLRDRIDGRAGRAEELGTALAELLIGRGADQILRAFPAKGANDGGPPSNRGAA